MKKYLKSFRRASAVCKAFNEIVLEAMMAASLLMTVTALGFWLWWQPINYLTEGDTFHERRISKFVNCVGFKNIRHVAIAMPSNQFRNFKTTCSVWVTGDDGVTYHPIEFTYRYERQGWLNGMSSFSPTREALAEKRAGALDKYLEWSGTTREQYEEMFAQQDNHLK